MRSFVPLFALLAAACAPDAAEAPKDAKVHAFTSGPEGFDTTTYWIDTGAEVVVFDTQFTPELAEAMLADIRAETDSPVTWVVITHPNPDKFNGATVFRDAGAEIVASEATAAAMPDVHAYKEAYFVGAGMFPEGGYPELPVTDVTFTDRLELELDGDVPVTLIELDHAGVTTTQTVASVPGGLIVGDLVAGRVHAWLEGGIVGGAPAPNLDAWKLALAELETLDPDAVVWPGRGEALPVATAAAEQQVYLDGMRTIVADYVGGLDDPMAALTGPDAGTHYAAITADAEAAYPEHGLSYLVTYGVYGLALQEAEAAR